MSFLPGLALIITLLGFALYCFRKQTRIDRHTSSDDPRLSQILTAYSHDRSNAL